MFSGDLLSDLSKEFDCICLGLLVAKLHVYGLSFSALKLMQGHLCTRRYRTISDMFYSTREEILSHVPQDLVLGLLLFNIYLCEFFFDHAGHYFANYVDNTTF